MEGVPVERLLLFLVFIVLPALNWILQRIKSRVETKTPEEPPPYVPRPRHPPSAPEPPRPRAMDHARSEEPPPPAPAQKRGFTGRSLFRSRQDLRRGVILMTVLGPCRALERPDA